MNRTVALLSALDTKADDADFLRRRFAEHGLQVLLIDVGVLGSPGLDADVGREAVAAAGGTSITDLVAQQDRSVAVASMAAGAQWLVADLVRTHRIEGVFAIGGGAGTTIGATAMRDLPLGLPKAILTTVAAGNTAGYLGTSDIVLFPSVVDVSGINRISEITYRRAADAFAGMVLGAGVTSTRDPQDRPLVAATMFGVTTACVLQAKSVLEDEGCEVVVFHATGTGGRTMERLIAEGHIDGVLDMTTTEWADEIVGGVLSAGPDRLGAAARAGVPQVVSLGATDMVNFGRPESIPPQFAGRRFYQHNAENTLMRVSADEAELIGRAIGGQLRQCRASCTVLLPANGTSALDAAGQPFDDPSARRAMQTAVTSALAGSAVRVIETAQHLNDRSFANMAARRLLALMAESSATRDHNQEAKVHV
jgi:uncharacterized protein (UPF0261 family)